ncbi:8-amino-7-oxononanoate synthase [Toxoplasma gondii TgCatPRC2]|uniref:serine C-palmitoyltransferase n=13 Tax=Toxoplasma gondii TaxID=5811 RepID=S7VXX9_TOXGG|nr:8-amino-7-oxononanoate synthase [Toxoplasma gondii ME49]EPR59824.1 8-amino-7-oxononanoate synthase [Toxoplasma gondii GT1]KAF4644538.1 8-amino-7-oxononanoate synthase [Toxoplasma gondii]KFG41400.1 8-amino-7-oxononanoate synthase [Toxoplasma gondii FOU]KFG42285.1 8-amino-7-oxononanoate synthase [Toxoplasma gondii GAB2-2007-GAL-DOM2]KFG62833.1 8-amino-7-oxononanoate synthase [Toxoplasma gondii RUB]KFG99986.1 8-amino-7-oxononanoate synthase [Toxoplasma gondii VAND]KFH05196.1 8-amino-7-oxonon|eukprot:XP_002368481.1 8-amino-7-oxononanoate synthase [Toxoplasma gondii ME49]
MFGSVFVLDSDPMGFIGNRNVEWTTNLDFFYCAFFSASLLGVLLAFFTDDVSSGSLRWSWIVMELLPVPRLSNHVAVKDVEGALITAAKQASGKSQVFAKIVTAAHEGTLKVLLAQWCTKLHLRCWFCWHTLKLRYTAESRRQLLYQVNKVLLRLENRKGEKEVQSYLDIKRYMQTNNLWYFAFRISDVKSQYITCEGKRAYHMSSYSYLDFMREPLVQEAALAAGRMWSTGNHGARMLGGNPTVIRELEQIIGRFFGREDALLCATGFLAAMSSICAVAKKGDLIIGDNRLHTSLRVGMKLSGAKEVLFRHNNWQHLTQILGSMRRKYIDCWIVIESVYSMDGDIADLPTVRRLADQYKCQIIVDEAHGLGVLGKSGRGLEEHFNMPGAADIIVGTFSKSIGGVGGFITCGKDLIEFLEYHALGSVFSAPLTAYSAGGAKKAFELMQGEHRWRIAKAQENAIYLRRALKTGNGNWPPDYPADKKYEVEGIECTTVIPVVFPNDPYRLCCVTRALFSKGWVVGAAMYPACPLMRPRIRITATAAYTKEIMDKFVRDLVKTTVDVPLTTEVEDGPITL